MATISFVVVSALHKKILTNVYFPLVQQQTIGTLDVNNLTLGGIYDSYT